jgi:hypothetical protein
VFEGGAGTWLGERHEGDWHLPNGTEAGQKVNQYVGSGVFYGQVCRGAGLGGPSDREGQLRVRSSQGGSRRGAHKRQLEGLTTGCILPRVDLCDAVGGPGSVGQMQKSIGIYRRSVAGRGRGKVLGEDDLIVSRVK